ncbi:MAG: T9SS type A sorting domain-containing protein, partial [Ginsengibacter sp.]
GSTGYYIIVVNANDDATDNNTIKINGAANPVVFGFTTSPTVVNSQTDAAGIQTIQAADITLSTIPVSTNTFPLGTNNNIVYVAQMSVATEPVTVNNIQFTLGGTHDANDLATVLVYFNGTSPTFSGSSFLGSGVATFAAPHTYNINVSRTMAIGSTGYYIIVVNTLSSGTIGNTVKIDGGANPVIFGFTTVPNVTDNQTDNGGLHTLPITFISVRAYEKSTGVNIEWKVANELNTDKYFVEKSFDGRTFNSIGYIRATGSATDMTTYNLDDTKPFTGDNFYRISALSKDGKTEYSSIVKLNLNKNIQGISIYPNPISKKGTLNLQLQNLSKGTYVISLFNQHGQELIKQGITHEGGNSVRTIALPKIADGMYFIEVRNADTRLVTKIIIQ